MSKEEDPTGWVAHCTGRAAWHQERADAHAEPMDHLHYLHTDAAIKHSHAAKLYRAGDPKAGKALVDATNASIATRNALEHVGKAADKEAMIQKAYDPETYSPSDAEMKTHAKPVMVSSGYLHPQGKPGGKYEEATNSTLRRYHVNQSDAAEKTDPVHAQAHHAAFLVHKYDERGGGFKRQATDNHAYLKNQSKLGDWHHSQAASHPVGSDAHTIHTHLGQAAHAEAGRFETAMKDAGLHNEPASATTARVHRHGAAFKRSVSAIDDLAVKAKAADKEPWALYRQPFLVRSAKMGKGTEPEGAELEKDYGYGGQEEAKELSSPTVPNLPSIVRQDPKDKHERKHPTGEVPKLVKARRRSRDDQEMYVPHAPGAPHGRATVHDDGGSSAGNLGELKLHPKSPWHGELRHPKTGELHGTYRWSRESGRGGEVQHALMTREAGGHTVYEGGSTEAAKPYPHGEHPGPPTTPPSKNPQKAAVDKSYHGLLTKDGHPRKGNDHPPKEKKKPASESRLALSAKTMRATQVLAERSRRATKKHGLIIGSSTGASKKDTRVMESKARRGMKSLDELCSLIKASDESSNALISHHLGQIDRHKAAQDYMTGGKPADAFTRVGPSYREHIRARAAHEDVVNHVSSGGADRNRSSRAKELSAKANAMTDRLLPKTGMNKADRSSFESGQNHMHTRQAIGTWRAADQTAQRFGFTENSGKDSVPDLAKHPSGVAKPRPEHMAHMHRDAEQAASGPRAKTAHARAAHLWQRHSQGDNVESEAMQATQRANMLSEGSKMAMKALEAAVNKACIPEGAPEEKAVPLSVQGRTEKPEQVSTAGGGQLFLQKIPGDKKQNKPKIDLGTAPALSAQKAIDALLGLSKAGGKNITDPDHPIHETAAENLIFAHHARLMGDKSGESTERKEYESRVGRGAKPTPEHVSGLHGYYQNQAKDPKHFTHSSVPGAAHWQRIMHASVAAASAELSGKPHHLASKTVEKAMTAMSMPRVTRAKMMDFDAYRSATEVMTRGNSRFAKDIHTGPLTGEVIEDLKEDEDRRTRNMPVYKSCSGCGRTYMAKSSSAECPTCSIRKSQYCACGSHYTKSQGGVACPLCG